MFLAELYREWRSRRRIRRRLAELMDEMSRLAAARRIGGAWREPTRRVAIGIHPDTDDAQPISRAARAGTARAR